MELLQPIWSGLQRNWELDWHVHSLQLTLNSDDYTDELAVIFEWSSLLYAQYGLRTMLANSCPSHHAACALLQWLNVPVSSSWRSSSPALCWFESEQWWSYFRNKNKRSEARLHRSLNRKEGCRGCPTKNEWIEKQKRKEKTILFAQFPHLRSPMTSSSLVGLI